MLSGLSFLAIIVGIIWWANDNSLEGGSGLVFSIPIAFCGVFGIYVLGQFILQLFIK